MGHIAAEGCLWLLLGAMLNVFGVAKNKHHPQGFEPECSSTHAYVPREGEDIIYFPEGHMEQIEAFMPQQLPAIVLPPKILCKVVNVHMWVEQESEQVCAEITLVPHQDQRGVAIQNPPMPEPPCCNVCSFCKTPAARDTSAPGGLRKTTHISVLATAHNAITTGTLFSVMYKPRAVQSSFIISVSRYLNALNPEPCVGMRFTMGFRSAMVLEERFGGIIVAVGDDASSKWPQSEWKSLKVEWDEPSPLLPDRVSRWDIELIPLPTVNLTCYRLQGLKV